VTSKAALATTVFGIAMVVTVVLGVLSSRGRRRTLAEWSVSGRSLGVVFVWLLMAGESYTSFSFLGTAGWTYQFGVPILYLVAYLGAGYAISYLVGPAIWTYAARHELISIADMAEHRFRSRAVGVSVAVVGAVFLVPYIQVQIQGMGAVVSAMTYGSVDLKVSAVVSFVVAEIFILVSGLRGTAWVSVLKDVLVIFSVVFLAVYVPVHFFGGIGALTDRLVSQKSEWLTFPGHTSAGHGAAWFISTVLLNGVTIAVFPTTVTGNFSARNPNTLRRNAILLPWYQLLLFIPMMIGAAALFVLPQLGNPDLALFALVTKALPAPVVAVIGVAGALSAIVPMSLFMLAIGNLCGRTLLGGGNGADPRSARARGLGRASDDGGQASDDRGRASDDRVKRLSQLVCLLAGVIALAGALWKPETLVQLSVLSYEGIAQLLPPVLLALFWRRMTASAAIAGLAVGTGVMIGLYTSGNDPFHGVNGGIIALAANLLVVAAVTYATGGRRTARNASPAVELKQP
jgi:SSS family solute:Na+ symporter